MAELMSSARISTKPPPGTRAGAGTMFPLRSAGLQLQLLPKASFSPQVLHCLAPQSKRSSACSATPCCGQVGLVPSHKQQGKRERPEGEPGQVQTGYEERFLQRMGCPAIAQLPRTAVQSSSLEGFKTHMHVAPGDRG